MIKVRSGSVRSGSVRFAQIIKKKLPNGGFFQMEFDAPQTHMSAPQMEIAAPETRITAPEMPPKGRCNQKTRGSSSRGGRDPVAIATGRSSPVFVVQRPVCHSEGTGTHSAVPRAPSRQGPIKLRRAFNCSRNNV